VTNRLLVDLGMDREVSVSAWLDGGLPRAAAEPFELDWPLDDGELEDLRWYLEDYLRVPYGVYGDKGPQVAAALDGWGQAIFRSVLRSGSARDAYNDVRHREGATEILFRSPSPALLALPWELLRDPARSTPVALDLERWCRSAFCGGGVRVCSPAAALAPIWARTFTSRRSLRTSARTCRCSPTRRSGRSSPSQRSPPTTRSSGEPTRASMG